MSQMNRTLKILGTRRFFPLFATQALEAFNDNAIRSVLLIVATYQIASHAGYASFIGNMGAILFNLPFIFLSHISGQLSEKYSKPKLTRYIKLLEVICMALAGVAVIYSNISLLLFCVFMMGVHSALFGPIKYAIIPDLVEPHEIIPANAWVESSTFAMILLGYIFGVFLASLTSSQYVTALFLLFVAVAGLVASLFIPTRTAPQNPGLRIDYQWRRQTRAMFAHAKQNDYVYTAILVIAWFWYFGITLQVQFSNYSKYVLHAEPRAVIILIATLALGVSSGAFACSRLLRAKNDLRYTPLALLSVSIFTFLLVLSSPHHSASTTHLISAWQFFSKAHHWIILIELFGISASAGLYVLPLYVVLQQSDPNHRSRTIATCNIAGAISMFLAGAVAIILGIFHITTTQLFALTGVLNLLVALYVCRVLPQAMLHSLFKWIIQVVYRVKVKGLENIPEPEKRMILIANHASFLDVPLLSCFIPRKLTFAINHHVARNRWVKPFLVFAKTIIVKPDHPMGMKTIIRQVETQEPVVIFPEGRISTTGSLMKVYEGAALIADKTDALIVPVRIDGVQFTRFARSKHFFSRFKPQLTINICSPQKLSIGPEIIGRARRQKLSLNLYDLMTNMLLSSSECNRTLFSMLLKARRLYGKKYVCLADTEYKSLNYGQLITKSYIIGIALRKQTQQQEHVGVMLATSLACSVLFFAAQSCARIPAMINFSSGFNAIKHACASANITKIYTARKFIEAAELEDLVAQLEQQKICIYYLEDMVNELRVYDKIAGLIRSKIDSMYQYQYARKLNAQQPAVILFTSGSEGKPKGAAISHYNINSNTYQVLARVNVTMRDVIFNTLPMFHCFGLTMGTILPVLHGFKAIMYPSPLHYRLIPEFIYEYNATILFSTNTFLMGYARSANAYDLYSIRYVFAGAEALKESTRKLYQEKFGIRIFEGYGVTETAPVVAVNTPMHNKPGTVGRLLPGMQSKLLPVEGIEDAGRLLLKGPNVMLGYMQLQQPGNIASHTEWHDTGDIVEIDSDGFIKILGRAKRFAKIAGEMVSLTTVENMIQTCWPEELHAVLRVQDQHKGERLLLITERSNAELSELLQYAQQNGYPEIMLPKKIIYLAQLPVLGSGKIDYVSLQASYT